MRPVRILVVDDLMAPRIRQILSVRFDPRWLLASFVEFAVFNAWTQEAQETAAQGCDIAIFDVRNANNEDVGHLHALPYAGAHPNALVIIKSAHGEALSPIIMEQIHQNANIKLAIGDWDAKMLRHVMEWARSSGAAKSVRSRFTPHDCAVSTESRQRFAAASTLMDADWFARARLEGPTRTAQLAMLEIFGKQLLAEARLGDVTGTNPYFRIKVEDHGSWMPWEYLLFAQQVQLRTPVAYWMPSKAISRPPWKLERILFVHQSTTQSWKAELAEIRRTLAPLALDEQPLVVDDIDLEEFLTRDDLVHTDVLHFAMHGPSDPTRIDERQRARLMRSIRDVTPAVVVLNACNGIYMLLNQGRPNYPISAAPLRTLFDEGVDTVLTTHFLLDDTEMPATWSRTFYLALTLTGDAAIAAALARSEVGAEMKSFSELATIAVSRQNSRLTSA